MIKKKPKYAIGDFVLCKVDLGNRLEILKVKPFNSSYAYEAIDRRSQVRVYSQDMLVKS